MKYNLPKLRSIQAFEACARHLNFHDAGLELNTSSADIDYNLQQLEKFVGYKLFIRGIGDLKLTRVGKDYLPSITQALEILKKSTEKLREKSTSLIVNIHTPLSFMNNFFAHNLGDFITQHPNIDLRVSTNPDSVDLERGNIDLYIKFGHKNAQTQKAYWLTRDDFFPVCTNGFLQKHCTPEDITLSDLKTMPLLHYTGASEDWFHWTQLLGMKDLDTSQGVYFNKEEDMLNAAREGVGICISRHSRIEKDLLDSKLIAPFKNTTSEEWGYYLDIAEDRINDPLIQQVRDWFLDLFRKDGDMCQKSV